MLTMAAGDTTPAADLNLPITVCWIAS